MLLHDVSSDSRWPEGSEAKELSMLCHTLDTRLHSMRTAADDILAAITTMNSRPTSSIAFLAEACAAVLATLHARAGLTRTVSKRTQLALKVLDELAEEADTDAELFDAIAAMCAKPKCSPVFVLRSTAFVDDLYLQPLRCACRCVCVCVCVCVCE